MVRERSASRRAPCGSPRSCRIMARLFSRMPTVGWSEDRKSTRLNSSHANISYAVFCLKKKQVRDHALVALRLGGCQLRCYADAVVHIHAHCDRLLEKLFPSNNSHLFHAGFWFTNN